MTKPLSLMMFFLTRFPRIHIAASLGLTILLGAAVLLPETGSSVPSRLESMELALPRRWSRPRRGRRRTDQKLA